MQYTEECAAEAFHALFALRRSSEPSIQSQSTWPTWLSRGAA